MTKRKTSDRGGKKHKKKGHGTKKKHSKDKRKDGKEERVIDAKTWLYAVRFYKTKMKAKESCTRGNVHVIEPSQGVPSKCKHTRKIIVGDELVIIRESGVTQNVIVKCLIDARVGAPKAQTCYRVVSGDPFSIHQSIKRIENNSIQTSMVVHRLPEML